jgi:GTPase SAR1 family protein
VWIDDLHKNLKEAQIILVANKTDIDEDQKLSYKRQVTYDEGTAFMKKHNLNYFMEVSAKTGNGVKELVSYVSKVLYHEYRKKLDEFKEPETGSVGSSYKSKNSNSLPSHSPMSGYS